MTKKFLSIILSFILIVSTVVAVPVTAAGNSMIYTNADIYAADCITFGVCDPTTGQASGNPNVSMAVLRDYTHKIIAEEIIDDGLLVFNSVYWQNLKNAIDGKFLEIANWQEAFYTVLIMDFLTYHTNTDEYKSNLSKNTVKFANEIYGNILDYANITYENEIDEIIENTSLSDAVEFSDKYGYVTKLKFYNDLAEDIVKVANSSRDYYKNLSKALAIQQANQGTVDYLLSLKAKASGNGYFTAAVDKVVEWYTASYSTLAFDNAVSTMSSYAVEATVDCVIKAYPSLEVIVKGLKTYSAGLNWLFNSDDLSENNLKMILLYTINSYALTSLQSVRDTYKSSRTAANAQELISNYTCFLDFQKYASNHTKGFITSALFDGMFNKIKNIFSDANELTYQELSQRIDSDISFSVRLNGLLDGYYNVYHNLLGYDESVITGESSEDTSTVTDIEFVEDSYTLFLNGYLINPAIAYPTGVSDNSLTYYSGNTSIATVDQNGKIIPVTYGTVKIYATSGTATGSCTITILPFYAAESGNGYSITSYAGNGGNVVIPKKAQGKNIVSIADKAFYWKSNITSVSIPSSVTSIGKQAFYYCSGLTSITIPDSVTTIADSAFSGCSKATSLKISNNITTIEDYTFSGCSNITSVTVPDSVISIGKNVFSDCSSLSGITISKNLVSVDEYAFSRCSLLKEITFPSSFTSLGYRSFYNCNSLESINVDGNNAVYTSSDGILYNKSMTKLIGYPNGKASTEFSLPSYVTAVGDEAFYGNCNLKSITLHDNVTEIGVRAFGFCKSLTNVRLPSTITKISNGLFNSSEALESINLPQSVRIIDDAAFSWCYNLKSINLPSNLNKIGAGAFNGCSYLTDIVIPESVNKIGNSAFFGCSGITNIKIPDSVTQIGEETFAYCSGLTKIEFSKNLKSIGYNAFTNCSALKSLVFPDSVTDISEYSFTFCRELKDIKFGKGITEIKEGTFYGCEKLENVKLPKTVNSIKNEAFSECGSNLNFRCYLNSYSHTFTKNNSLKYSIIYDASGDNFLNSKDLAALRNFFLKGNTVTLEADCNEDGNVNLKDMIRLKKYLAGIITE